MKKMVIVLLLLALILPGCGNKATGAVDQSAREEPAGDLLAKGRQITGMTYDYVLTTKTGQMTGKMWVQGKKMRTETVLRNQRVVSLIDADANTAYTYMPDQGTAFKISFEQQAKTMNGPERYTKELEAAGAKAVESVVYEGVKCKIFVVQKEGNVESRIWVREDYGVPARAEVTNGDGGKLVMEYKNLVIGPIPADVFQLPVGVKVTDMSGVVQQIPQKPQ